ncbi:MAG: asparagine--tRNA ligase [Cytophagales bacterium]|nr:MAG: asparagine--tRNA ligase [Cytophagales bacterium]TAF61376.1 MAG: asparagine--tRNA ligase [Cytophagales bacterium]
MNLYSVKQLLYQEGQSQSVHIKGWVRTKRGNKFVNFLALNDGSCIKNIQIVADTDKFSEELMNRINTGACIAVQGSLVSSQGKGQSVEIHAKDIVILGEADAEAYPLQKKKHTLEFLREIAHLRPRTNTFGAVLRIRHTLAFAIHEYFNNKGFFYLHTPLITGSDAEGAGQMFRVTTLDPKNPPLTPEGNVDYSKDFFGKATNLTVSGQLEGELGAMGLGLVYTFGPTFRAENSNTSRHLAEFWMIEPEMAFYDINDNMDLAEDFIKYLVSQALLKCSDDLQFLSETYDPELINRLKNVVETSFARVSYTEAVEILLQSQPYRKGKFEYPVSWGTDLQSEHERYLVEKHFQKPVIVNNYPKDIKAFYMRQNEDGKTVAAMDVLFPQIGEIIGGSQREERYDKLLTRIKEMNIPEHELWWYLETRQYGTCPHAGFGLGFERLVLFVTGMGNIRDVIPFPRTPQNADF